MPDWTYQTLFRPVLRQLRPEVARDLALGAMGRLARFPGGRMVIRLMGHMKPDDRLACQIGDLKLATPIGISCRLDPQLLALDAFAEMGIGWIEIGPVRSTPVESVTEIAVDWQSETITFPQTPSLGVATVHVALKRRQATEVPVIARLEPKTPEELAAWVETLSPYVAGFVIPASALSLLPRDLSLRMLLIALPLDQLKPDPKQRDEFQSDERIHGFIIDRWNDAEKTLGRDRNDDNAAVLQSARRTVPPSTLIVSSLPVHEPIDAVRQLAAGADLVLVDSGFVFAGPGICKRVNEALLYRKSLAGSNHSSLKQQPGTQAWFWAFLMGLAMFLGGLLAMGIACTRVVMPYDEDLVGMTREQLTAINVKLLDFMTHDRVTLAGTMFAVGVLYMSLAWFGIRRGARWAHHAIVVSAFAGFISFFSFLGFGYFDPFHAFVTAILFQMLIMTLHCEIPLAEPTVPPGLWNNSAWRNAQWGQLLFVTLGAVLIVAGGVISWVGMTSVFVAEDLEFMETTIGTLCGVNPRLVPLVAHDRATFGGMLIASGLVTLLSAMWGITTGRAWLWWTLMIAGNVAFIATIAVHWWVGYTSLVHLIPAYAGLALVEVAGWLTYGELVRVDARLNQEWRQLSTSFGGD